MTPLLPGNQISLLQNGAEFFPALLKAIAQAQQTVHLETYIFELDKTGSKVCDALNAAARRGVQVRVVVDGIGSRDFIQALQATLSPSGVEFLVFRKDMGLFALQRKRLRRLHRKLTVVDSRIAFVGGINIVDDCNTSPAVPPRFDYAIRIEGPLVRLIVTVQAQLWHLLSWANFHKRPRVDKQSTTNASQAVGTTRAALVVRDNLRHRKDIEKAYLVAISRARYDILIANAYFLPGRRFRAALLEARLRGVKVTLLLQGRIEYWLLHHACQAIYPQLLAAGVHIIEYRKSYLHAKVAVIDKDWATVGSSNIDPFSLMLAREANVIIRDAAFTHELRSSLLAAIADGGTPISADYWQKRSWLRRLLSWAAFGLVRSITGRLVRHGE